MNFLSKIKRQEPDSVNWISRPVKNFRERGYASLCGLILNRRDVPDERTKVETLASDIHTEIAADLPRDNAISEAEVQGLPVFETAPDSDYANAVRDLARKMLADYDKENAHDSEAQ